MNNEQKFLIGLEKLSRKTGIFIGGCGHCASPYLYEIGGDIPKEAGYGFGEDSEVKWISPDDKSVWEDRSWTIEKGL